MPQFTNKFKVFMVVLGAALCFAWLGQSEAASGKETSSCFSNKHQNHTVKEGESFASIATAYGTSPEKFVSVNKHYESLGRLPQIGDDLCVPIEVAKLVPKGEKKKEPNAEPNKIAFRAYKKAAKNASCPLEPELLAGIGFIETRHGTYGGTFVREDLVSEKKIIGIALNGRRNTARILDSDGGLHDGDKIFDRAVGPMQFIPTSWKLFGVDGSGDGVADPHNIEDAAAAAAKHLCKPGLDLKSNEGDVKNALFSYNRSRQYGRDVMTARNYYRTIEFFKGE